MTLPAFETEMHDQVARARRELADACAAADTDGIGLAEARLADLIDLAHRQGVDVDSAAR